MRVAPDEAPCELLGIGVDQQLVRIEAQSALGVIWTMNPVTVELSGGDVVETAVPDILGALGQRDALDLAPAMAVEQAELDSFRVGREQREIRSAPVPGGPQGVRRTGRKLHVIAPG